jgi:hypothetical protein
MLLAREISNVVIGAWRWGLGFSISQGVNGRGGDPQIGGKGLLNSPQDDKWSLKWGTLRACLSHF